jgi:hypothetical protein
MIILATPYGQTSNKLFQFIHLDSFCRENNLVFSHVYMEEFKDVYPQIPITKPCFPQNIWLKLFSSSRLLTKLFCLNLIDEQKIEQYKKVFKESEHTFCYGFFFRSKETTLKYRNLYQKMFTPNFDKISLDQTWLKRDFDQQKIVAIHIRRGDYKGFEGGRYYYSDQVYLSKMNEIQDILGHKPKFILFTNDADLNLNEYLKQFSNQVSLSKNSVAVDHYLLSKTDYIIGPPSTFTLWASYIGEVKLYQIEDPTEKVDLSQFFINNGF